MSTSILEKGRRCLVLNKSWRPIGTITLRDAIEKIFSEYDNGEPKARIIEPGSYQTFTWEDWSALKPDEGEGVLKGINSSFRVPEIILLSRYDHMPERKMHFSRRNLFKRDKMECQYCGKLQTTFNVTIDHVTPRAQGGKTTWTNCVACCVKCNRKKADKTPEQAQMKLLNKPKKPTHNLLDIGTSKPIKSWEAFIGEAYFNVELENDN